jgi:hypothetical protein
VARTGFFREIAVYIDRRSVYHSSYECPDYPEPRGPGWRGRSSRSTYDSAVRRTCRARVASPMAPRLTHLTTDAGTTPAVKQ